jgi:hypothetical protein
MRLGEYNKSLPCLQFDLEASLALFCGCLSESGVDFYMGFDVWGLPVDFHMGSNVWGAGQG